jgi:hypothetical protein
MCFSATASFSASAFLLVIAFFSIKKTTKISELFFASIPILFAIQQFSEGILWLTFGDSNYYYLSKFSGGIFIIIAQVVWPIWVPFSVYQIEKSVLMKKAILVFVGLGFILSLCFFWYLLTYGFEPKIENNHILYLQYFPKAYEMFGTIFYILATVVPLFLSTYRRMWILGFAILISYGMIKWTYANYLFSVWCFFAAICSCIVYYIVLEIKQKENDPINFI